MIGLGVIEGAGGGDLAGDRAQTGLIQGLLEGFPAGLGGGLLGSIEGVDGRAILGADIVALAHALLV